MVVDIGGGTTEIAVLSLGGIVTSSSIRVGGDRLDDAIVHYIRRTHNLLIGETTAERIKKTIGAAQTTAESDSVKMFIKGRCLRDGVPKEIEITQTQICEALSDVVRIIVEGVKALLERTEPELASDIVERGIMLTGGGAMLSNLDLVLHEATGVPIHISENPLNCVVMGTGRALEEMKILNTVLI